MTGTASRGIAARAFCRELAVALVDAAADAVVGVYLHGSAVLGDWTPTASDVDVLVVVVDEVSSAVANRVADVLVSDRDCPGVGLEVSVVEASSARAPGPPWPFVVHATTHPNARKTVWGTPGAGDTDLILHYAVARDHGWTAHGPDPKSVVGAVPDDIVIEQLVRELRWAVEHANETYAVLNACRALRYRDDRVLCSKTDGGTWALARGIQPALVQAAMAARRDGSPAPISDAAAEWVRTVAATLGA